MGADVTAGQLVFCALVIVVAFAVRGAAGFGGGALATPLLALTLPVQIVVPVVTVLNFAASLEHGVRHSSQIRWREIAFVIPFVLAGVLAGLYLLGVLHAVALRRALGGFVIAYALFGFATSGRPVHAPRALLRPLGAALAAAAGFVGTLFGGAAGLLIAIYYSNLRLEPAVFRVTIATTLLILAAMRTTGYAGLGLFHRTTLVVLAVSLPFMWVGGRVADRFADRLSLRAFNAVVGATLLVSGTALLLK